MKHLELFNYKSIFSGFCCGPDIFFFLLWVLIFFFPQKLVLFDVSKS